MYFSVSGNSRKGKLYVFNQFTKYYCTRLNNDYEMNLC